MRSRPAGQPSWVGRQIDRFADAVSPRWGADRRLWRVAARNAALGYRNSRRTRTDKPLGMSGHPDAINEQSWDRFELLNRARELERDNQLACAMLDRWVENVVSTGFKLQAQTEDDTWNSTLEALWADWVQVADVRGIDNFDSLLGLAARSFKRDGGVGTILIGKGKRKGTLQLLESDQIKSPPGSEKTSEKIVDGVEIDAWGAPTAYHVIDPGSKGARIDRRVQTRLGQLTTKRVDAKNFVHVASRKRVGQTRGITAFAQSAWLFEQLDGVIEAVANSARIAACFGVVLKKPGGFPGLASITGGNAKSYKAFDLEPAMVKTLEPGEDIETLNPSQPQQNMVSFVRMIARLLGVSFAFPLELVLMDFSETNYSSARAALLQAQRAFRVEQKFLVSQWCQPIYRWKVQEWIDSGLLADRPDKFAVNWVTPGWKWVDPEKEVKAAALAIEVGLKTLTECHADQSTSIEDFIGIKQRETAMLEAAGIELSKTILSREPLPPVDPEAQAGPPQQPEDKEEEE